MIKWKFIFIRISLFIILVTALQFLTGPFIGFMVRTAVQVVTGSKLEIEDLNASLFQAQLTTGPVRLGHPEKEFENFFDFDRAEIKFDQAALLRKKFIVTHATVEGLRTGADRDESGVLERGRATASPATNQVLKIGEQASDHLGSLLNQRFEENFESVQLAREILRRWPDEYRQLTERGKKLTGKISLIRDLAEELQENPLNTLRDLPKVEQGLQNALRIRDEIDFLRHQLTEYRIQIVNDRDGLLDAKQRDMARIREIQSDKRLNGRSLAQLLIGDTQGQRVDQAIDWIKWTRKTFPHPKKTLKASRGRGETIRFDGQRELPDFLVRTLKINGHGTMESKPYTFTGTVNGLTTQPEIYGKPASLQLEANGNIQFTLKGTIDRSQSVDYDQVIIKIPELKVSSKEIKIDDRTRLCLIQSNLELVARIELKGDQLGGQIKAIQRDFGIKLESDSTNDFACDLISQLNQDFNEIREFEVIARISGCVGKPEWRLHSDLGTKFSKAIQQTLTQSYKKKKSQLLARLELESAESLQAIIKLMQHQEEKIIALLTQHSAELVRLQSRVSSLIGPTGLRFR